MSPNNGKLGYTGFVCETLPDVVQGHLMILVTQKKFSLVFLIAVITLGAIWPVLAYDLGLNPNSGCPATSVFLVDDLGGYGNRAVLSSTPSGLIKAGYRCQVEADHEPECWFTISDCVVAGTYMVIVTLTRYDGSLESSGWSFTVREDCPDLGPCPVGGVVEPVNTFVALGPWLASVCLVGCMTIVVLVTKKRRL